MATLADLDYRDKDAEPPGGSPKALLQQMKDDMWLSGRSIGDINDASVQLVSAMTQRGASSEPTPVASKAGGGTSAMTPVSDVESKLAEVKAQYKIDQL